ncbi:hypothetical protein ABE24_03145 [Cytobacillus firmus]|nr:hypothetical protein [Cytobacillus firmus]
MKLEPGFGFGHRMRISGDMSPNLVHLRTQKVRIREFESELGATSDTERGNLRVRVRTWSIF